jgi:hypothetical protein
MDCAKLRLRSKFSNLSAIGDIIIRARFMLIWYKLHKLRQALWYELSSSHLFSSHGNHHQMPPWSTPVQTCHNISFLSCFECVVCWLYKHIMKHSVSRFISSPFLQLLANYVNAKHLATVSAAHHVKFTEIFPDNVEITQEEMFTLQRINLRRLAANTGCH